jgi:predicted aconitase with swiveling domain
MELKGDILMTGPEVSGPLVYTEEPLSFWGGYDPATGQVVDRHHPLFGVVLAGKILAIPGGRGSSTASGVLLEAVRVGKAPAAFVVTRLDPILILGLVLAEELYQRPLLMVRIDPTDFSRLSTTVSATVYADGRLTVTEAP